MTRPLPGSRWRHVGKSPDTVTVEEVGVRPDDRWRALGYDLPEETFVFARCDNGWRTWRTLGDFGAL